MRRFFVAVCMVVCSLLIFSSCGKSKFSSIVSSQEDNTIEDYGEEYGGHINLDDEKTDDTLLYPMTIGEYLKNYESIWLDVTDYEFPLNKGQRVRAILHFKDGKVEYFDMHNEEYCVGDFSKMSSEEIIEIGKKANQKVIDEKIKVVEDILSSGEYDDSYSQPIGIYKEYLELLKNYDAMADNFGDFSVDIETDETGNNTKKECIRILYTNQIPREKINKLFHDKTLANAEGRIISGKDNNAITGGNLDENIIFDKLSHEQIDLSEYDIIKNPEDYLYEEYRIGKIKAGEIIYDSEFVVLAPSEKAISLCSNPSLDLSLDTPQSEYIDRVDYFEYYKDDYAKKIKDY